MAKAEGAAAPLCGLLLAGGQSRRMSSDKAALIFGGQAQLHRSYELLSSVCKRAYVSVRPDQAGELTRRNLPQIPDVQEGLGPIGGIVSAQQHQPGAAWLVVACDLPLLDRETLEYLIRHRNPARPATAYGSVPDGLPEPLCAIWEPASETLIGGFLERDLRCPRKLLIEADTELLEQPNPRALVNVNTPADLEAAHDLLRLDPAAKPAAKAIHLRFFAAFREQAGCGAETVTTQARTVGELFSDACERHGLADGLPGAKVAVNDELVPWSASLSDGDTVLFFPPVAGG